MKTWVLLLGLGAGGLVAMQRGLLPWRLRPLVSSIACLVALSAAAAPSAHAAHAAHAADAAHAAHAAAATVCLEIDVAPSPAGAGAPVIARLAGTWRDSCTPTPAGWGRVDDEIVLQLVPSAGGCLSALTEFDFEMPFGPLQPGDYTARAEVAGVPECTAGPEPFTVVPAPAGVRALDRPGTPPAATLLLPYFEVDLGASDGLTTLFAVANGSFQPTLAHVVLWSDLGIPTLAFDLPLEGYDVQTINLRDLFVHGRLPPMPAEPAFPGCLAMQRLPDAVLRAELVAQHTGRPHPRDGLCYGSGLAPGRATGYVTVDVAVRCSTGTLYPTQPGYFAGDDPVAGTDNVLWGDYFYIDSADASAQGANLVGLAAVPGRTLDTFYGRYPDAGADGREPLASDYLARFLHGGPFDGGTDFVVWLQEMTGQPSPRACAAAPSACHRLEIALRDEDGVETGSETVAPVPALAYRQPAVSLDLPVVPSSPRFGVARLGHRWDETCAAGQALPPVPVLAPAWVSPVMRAAGRYSVGVEATPIWP